MPMLEVLDLCKTFDRKAGPALDHVSFEVGEGEIFGLLGHNGAGKSTALGIMLGLVYPDSGEVRLHGVSVQKERERALRDTGAIFETPAFFDYMSGLRNLEVLTEYSGGVSAKEVAEVVDLVGLRDRIGDRVSTYSHGMRQRLALAQALLPRPRILLLDEPTDGLDPDGIVEFRERLKLLRNVYGVTILLNSHLLAEVEQICDRVVILRSGRKVYEGTSDQWQGNGDSYRVEAEDWAVAEMALRKLDGVEIAREGRITISATIAPADVLAALVSAGARIGGFVREEISLEDVYMQVRRAGGEDGRGENS